MYFIVPHFIFITNSSIPSIPALYHTLIKISTVFNFGSIFIIFNPDPVCHVLPFPIAPPSEITLILFDLVIDSLEPVFLRQGYHTLQYFILTNQIVFLFLSQKLFLLTLQYLWLHSAIPLSLQQQLSLPSTNLSSSSNKISKKLVHPTSLSKHLASRSIVPNRIVSHSIAPNSNHLSRNIVSDWKFYYQNMCLTLFLPRLFEMSTGLTFLSFLYLF